MDFYIDTYKMYDAVTKLEALNGEITQTITDINSATSELCMAWTGNSATLQKRISDGLETKCKSLNTMIEKFRTTLVTNYPEVNDYIDSGKELKISD